MFKCDRRILVAVALVGSAALVAACKAAMRPDDAAGVPPVPAAASANASADSSAAAKSDNPCVSSKCHATILAQKNVHDVAEGCTDCHNAESEPHPQAGKKTFALASDPPDLCYQCHDEYGKKKTVHPPAGDGDCTECHDPHSTAEPHLMKMPTAKACAECHEGISDLSVVHGPVADGDCSSCHNPHETDTESLLVESGSALCTSCHTEIAEEVAKAEVPHGALDSGDGCLGCHSPHSSNESALLLKPVRTVCLECHDEVPGKASVHHDKAKAEDCSDCHTPHGGNHEELLVAPMPAGTYVAWSETAYPLCFQCHDRKMVNDTETSAATAFRDGRKNLHSAHVGMDKGRSCRTCHEWHGSDHPGLVRDEVPFGNWSFRMKFVKTETGGSCAPACHRLEVYDRDSPGRRPPREKTASKGGR